MADQAAQGDTKSLRLAVGSLLDIVAELAEVAGGDEAWKETVREVIEQHRIELGFTR